jgi:hypothetical protein
MEIPQIAVSPTSAQQRRIVEIQKRNRFKSPEPVARRLLEFALQFADTYGYGIVSWIAAGHAPAELSGASLQRLLRRRRAHDLVHLEVTGQNLRHLCEGLAAGIYSQIIPPYAAGVGYHDFAGIVAAWRACSPCYVNHQMAREGESKAEAKNVREFYDDAADLLEQLIASA